MVPTELAGESGVPLIPAPPPGAVGLLGCAPGCTTPSKAFRRSVILMSPSLPVGETDPGDRTSLGENGGDKGFITLEPPAGAVKGSTWYPTPGAAGGVAPPPGPLLK